MSKWPWQAGRHIEEELSEWLSRDAQRMTVVLCAAASVAFLAPFAVLGSVGIATGRMPDTALVQGLTLMFLGFLTVSLSFNAVAVLLRDVVRWIAGRYPPPSGGDAHRPATPDDAPALMAPRALSETVSDSIAPRRSLSAFGIALGAFCYTLFAHQPNPWISLSLGTLALLAVADASLRLFRGR